MRIGAIIAEYNPFHNGHKYQIETFKKESSLDYVIVIMSGNFTQRGEPAWMPKHLRAKMALFGGADLVIELPLYYATGSASHFAQGAVAHLNALGCIDELCFGCEFEKDITELNDMFERTADILMNEPEDYKFYLNDYLRKGFPYPSAREKALSHFIENIEVLFSPNNILGLEYILALKKSKSKILPKPIRRQGQGYHSSEYDHLHPSASALRRYLSDTLPIKDPKGLSTDSMNILRTHYHQMFPINMEDFSSVFASAYMKKYQKLTDYMDINDDIAHLMQKNIDRYNGCEDYLSNLKTKAYTYTRLSRCLIHLITEQTKKDFDLFIQNGTAYYARVLGFRKSSAEIFNHLKKNTSIPIITKMTVYKEQLDPIGIRMIEQDIYAADVYRLITQIKYKSHLKNEFNEEIVIL